MYDRSPVPTVNAPRRQSRRARQAVLRPESSPWVLRKAMGALDALLSQPRDNVGGDGNDHPPSAGRTIWGSDFPVLRVNCASGHFFSASDIRRKARNPFDNVGA